MSHGVEPDARPEGEDCEPCRNLRADLGHFPHPKENKLRPKDVKSLSVTSPLKVGTGWPPLQRGTPPVAESTELSANLSIIVNKQTHTN